MRAASNFRLKLDPMGVATHTLRNPVRRPNPLKVDARLIRLSLHLDRSVTSLIDAGRRWARFDERTRVRHPVGQARHGPKL